MFSRYMLVAVNLMGDVDQDEEGDGPQDDVDEPEVCVVTQHPVEKAGKRVQDPERDDVEARQRRDLRIPLEEVLKTTMKGLFELFCTNIKVQRPCAACGA